MSEQDIITAIRNNPGGIGSDLTENQKKHIIEGLDNKTETMLHLIVRSLWKE